MRRFSQVAFGSVVALVATGIYQSWRQLGSWSAFTGTRYGQLLLVKIGLVVLLVGIASISRRWTARLADTAVLTPGKARDAGAREADEGDAQGEKEPAAARAGAGSAKTATATASGEARGAGGSGSAGDSQAAADRERAAQLARQQAAVDTARQKRQRDADPAASGCAARCSPRPVSPWSCSPSPPC